MARGIEIDWVVVRVNTLRRVLAFTATGVVAAGLLLFAYSRLHLPPQALAGRAIERAERAAHELEGRVVADTWKKEIRQAHQQLDQAKGAYDVGHWARAQELADDARQRFEAVLGAGEAGMVGAGQVFSLEGRVSIQRAGKSEWTPAHERTPLFNGDFIRTGEEGSAEILFADGTLYRVTPDTLLEIHHRPASAAGGAVKMVVGRINVFTSSQPSTVTTDTAQTRVNRESRVAVDVEQTDHSTRVAAYSGGAQVRTKGGRTVSLRPNQRVVALPDGNLSATAPIPPPPLPAAPRNNAVFDLKTSPIIGLKWRLAPDAAGAILQVSRSRRFGRSTLDVNTTTPHRDWAHLKALAPGTYYWRVAALDAMGTRSEWSPVRRFQVTSAGRLLPFEDRMPPKLEVEPARQMGQLFIVEGRTEVGATVTINDEPVDVDADGHFRKAVEVSKAGWNDLVIAAVDPAGNRTERRQRVYVEVY